MASALIAMVTVLGAAVTGVLPASAGTAAPPPAARELLGVSCVTAGNCLAVGIDYNALKERAARWPRPGTARGGGRSA